VASSFGTGSRPHKFSATLAELHSSVWMAGELDLVRRDIKGRPLWLAVQRGVDVSPGRTGRSGAHHRAHGREFFSD
jgi:hypothetical protein